MMSQWSGVGGRWAARGNATHWGLGVGASGLGYESRGRNPETGRGNPETGTRNSELARGFTLLEVLMALTILVIGVVGVYSVLAVALISHKRAVDNTEAALLAANLFDDIAANYDVYYYDRSGDGTPDLSLDRNGDGTPDWFELVDGRLIYPIPWRRGYRYTVQYEHSAHAPQALFVTVRVYWQHAGIERAEVFRRSVFIKHLPLLHEH
jgi:prepilin-type N-terminal cleavage/methylation domain-containing protein